MKDVRLAAMNALSEDVDINDVFLTPSGEVLTAEEARLRRAETGNAFAALPAWFVARASDLFLLFWREDA